MSGPRHHYLTTLERAELAPLTGRVTAVGAGQIEANGPAVQVGSLCRISREGGSIALAEAVAVRENLVTLVPLEDRTGIALGAAVRLAEETGYAVGESLAGRAIDALGRALDGATLDPWRTTRTGAGPALLDRIDPVVRLDTGIRAIDALMPIGVGQRIGIFAASGVGKSSLLGQLVAQIACDRLVLCLVGERGREVSGFWDAVTAGGRRDRTTMVAATSDESAPMRVRAVEQALAAAGYWRDRGEHVLLVIDSVTRYAMALREIGLAAGAPPTVRAYTPNIFAALPRLVESSGATRAGGAITAIMTVLSETDAVDDPVVEIMKSLLDGHIILSRSMAESGHFPAIDVLRSVSRQSTRLMAENESSRARSAIAALATYDEARVMVESGIYRAGSTPALDDAIARRGPLQEFLRQGLTEKSSRAASAAALSTTGAGGNG